MKVKTWIKRNNIGWKWIKIINRVDAKIKDTRFTDKKEDALEFTQALFEELKAAYPDEKFETDEAQTDIQPGQPALS